MSEKKHTAGPWHLGAGDTSRVKAGSGTQAFTIAEVMEPTRRHPEIPQYANSLLIAAAPSYAKAWAMVPEEIRERILVAIDSRDAAAIDRAEVSS